MSSDPVFRPKSSLTARVDLPVEQRYESSIANMAERQDFERRGAKPARVSRPGSVGRTDAVKAEAAKPKRRRKA